MNMKFFSNIQIMSRCHAKLQSSNINIFQTFDSTNRIEVYWFLVEWVLWLPVRNIKVSLRNVFLCILRVHWKPRGLLVAPGHFVPGNITQPTASLGQSNYFIIMLKSYRGYSDACTHLEKKLNKPLKTNIVLRF